jgi:DNA-binding MarR family transcriptional regulator
MGRKTTEVPRRTSFPTVGELVAPHVNTLSKHLTRLAVQQARRRFSLGQVEWQIITLLGVFQPISIRELTFHALLDQAQVSRAVAALVERGHVLRRRSARDGREAELTLTPQGMSLHADLSIAAIQRNKYLLEGVSSDEIHKFIQMLDMLSDRARTLLDSSDN